MLRSSIGAPSFRDSPRQFPNIPTGVASPNLLFSTYARVDPTPADGAVITPNVRKSIDSWNHRNKLTREALLNALKPDDLAKIDGI